MTFNFDYLYIQIFIYYCLIDSSDLIKYYKNTNYSPIDFSSYYLNNNYLISNCQYYQNNQVPFANLCSPNLPINISYFPQPINPQAISNQYYLQNNPYQFIPSNFNYNVQYLQQVSHSQKPKSHKKDHIKSKSKHHHHKKHSKKSSKDKKSGKHGKSSISIEYDGNAFCGIIWSLTQKHSGNVNDKGIINITGDRSKHKNDSFYGSFSSLVDYNYSGRNCFLTDKNREPVILFDFKEHKIIVSSYSIKSSNLHGPSCLQSWSLEGSDDLKIWNMIDSHSNDRCLCDTTPANPKVCNFKVQKQLDKPVRYIRLRETNVSSHGQWPYGITNIEFFGKYS